MNIEEADDDIQLDAFDAILVGSPIHVREHHTVISEFVAGNRTVLNDRPTACFQVSLSSAVDDPERRAEVARYVDYKPTIVGGWLNPDYERLRELDPGVVCTSDELQREIRDELRDRGYDVVHREPSRLADVLDGFESLGAAVGASEAGRRLREDTEARIDVVQSRVADHSRPVVYCEEWSDPPMAAGNWVPEAVRAAGGRYPFVAPGERSREIHVVDDALLNQPSPRLVEGIELLARRLHPED